MTNQEMLLAAIEFEEVEFGYDLFYLISYGHLDGSAQYDNPDWNLVDKSVVNELMRQNVLGFDIKHLYGVRTDVTSWHLFLATDDSQARGYALNKLGGGKVVKFPKEKKLTAFWMPDTKEYKTIAELEKESNIFPRHALII